MFDAWLSPAGHPSPGGVGGLVRHGEVARSVSEALRAVGASRPDVILLHEHLPSGLAREPGAGPLAVATALTTHFGPDTMPPCVLMTGRLYPPEVERFRRAGGAHVIDWSSQGLAERRDVIRAALRGERWRHAPAAPQVGFTSRDLALLPYLDADLSANETARRLALTDEQVHDSRRALYGRLLRADAVGFVLAGHTTALAAAALRAGAIWAPLDDAAPCLAR